VFDKKQFLDIEGLKIVIQEISTKIKESVFSGNYEDLSNKPTIQNMSVDEETETLIIK
jgi:hypothetical protein